MLFTLALIFLERSWESLQAVILQYQPNNQQQSQILRPSREIIPKAETITT